MPYKKKEYQRKYQREWISKRKDIFFEGKHCNNCGSTKNLELDHVNPSNKISHNIWSWSIEKRNEELRKCQILCNKCHANKTIIENSERERSLTNKQIIEIRERYNNGESITSISKDMPIKRRSVSDVARKVSYKHIQ